MNTYIVLQYRLKRASLCVYTDAETSKHNIHPNEGDTGHSDLLQLYSPSTWNWYCCFLLHHKTLNLMDRNTREWAGNLVSPTLLNTFILLPPTLLYVTLPFTWPAWVRVLFDSHPPAGQVHRGLWWRGNWNFLQLNTTGEKLLSKEHFIRVT